MGSFKPGAMAGGLELLKAAPECIYGQTLYNALAQRVLLGLPPRTAASKTFSLRDCAQTAEATELARKSTIWWLKRGGEQDSGQMP